MTVVGVAFAVAFAGCLLRPRLLPWALAAAVPFQHNAMIYVAGSGVSPFYVGAVGSCLRAAVLLHRRRGAPWRRVAPLRLLVLYGAAITVLGPMIFAGVPVLSPRLGIDDQLGNETPLTFTVSHVAQLGYLLLGAGVVLHLVLERRLSRRVFEAALLLGLGLAAVRAAVPAHWPYAVFDNMPNIRYDVFGHRERGTFAEPSVFGAFLAAATAYLLTALRSARGGRRAALAVGLLVAVAEISVAYSGTALVSLALLGFGLVVTMLHRAAGNGFRGIDKAVPLVIGVVVVALFRLDAVQNLSVGLVGEKLASGSFQARTAADAMALRLTAHTWGIGLGLGSNRPSSLLTMLLSCVGVVGTLAFLALVARAVRRALRHGGAPIAAALAATVLAQITAKPDLSMPLMWFLLAAALAVNAPESPRGAPQRWRKSLALKVIDLPVDAVPSAHARRGSLAQAGDGGRGHARCTSP